MNVLIFNSNKYSRLPDFVQISLFHRVIMISGTDMATWAYNPEFLPPENYTKEVARAVNCPDSPAADMIACMRGKSHEDISEIREMPIVREIQKQTLIFEKHCQ